MTAFTYVLGAVSLKALRSKFGRTAYWGATLAITIGMFASGLTLLSISFLSLVVLMGVFSELEEMGFSFRASLLYTLLINSLLAGAAFAAWVYAVGPKWSQTILTQLENMMKRVMELNPQAEIQINYFEVMLVLPSVIVVMWIFATYLAVLLENRLVSDDVEKTEREAIAEPVRPTMRRQMAEMRLPDVVIWAFIAGLLAALGGSGRPGVEAVGANVLNVCFVLLFFQGIAVVGKFFETLRLSSFWHTLFMGLVVIYLFPFVSLIGLSDYWIDFRTRLAKRTKAEYNRET